MAHNSNYTKIWAENGNGLTMTELHNALGVGGGLGYAITNGTINKWAKYKPFRSTSANFATNDGTSGTYLTDREKARQRVIYGFSPDPSRQSVSDTPMITFTNNVMDNKDASFVYYRPDGTYWFRMLDLDGYMADAVMGFKLALNTMYYNTINGAVFHFGLSSISGFDSRYCLTPQDVLSEAHGSMYVGVLLSKAGSFNKYFVSSGKTLNELRSNVGVALFAGQSVSGASGYAIVPALANEWRGQQVTAAVILAPTEYSDPTQCYDFKSLYANCYSLEFTRNLDRVTLPVTQDQSGMDLTKLSIARATTPTGTHGTTDGGNWHYYNNISPLSLSIYANSGWSSSAKTVYYELVLTEASGGGMWVANYSSMEGIQIKVSGSFSIAQGGTQYVGYTFAAATALKVYKEIHQGKFNISLILSTEPNGGGQTKTYSDSITLGTW